MSEHSASFRVVRPVFDAMCKGAEANPDEMDEDEVCSYIPISFSEATKALMSCLHTVHPFMRVVAGQND